MIDTSPAAPSTHALTVTPVVEPTTQADLTAAQASQMAESIKDDLVKGEMTQAQADKAFTELNTPVEQRSPDTRSDEQKQLDAQFPAGKPQEFLIRYGEVGQEPTMTPELKAFDQSACLWLSGAGFPRDTGNSLITQIAQVAQTTKDRTPDQLEQYGFAEWSKPKHAHGPALPEKL